MSLNSKEIQLQFEGFLNTPKLWTTTSVYTLKQFKFELKNTLPFNGNILKNQRLGKRVESFVSFVLNQTDSCKILIENAQIQNNKTTLGELDCILLQNNTPVHLEVIYKFYLYDKTVGKNEIEHWIGPNRKDSLVAKLNKLKEKQLPILFSSFTKPLLKKLNIDIATIHQQVLFKAQLFTPYNKEKPKFNLLNKECVKGFYIHYNQLSQFNDCKFYIPTKLNWLQEIRVPIRWLTYEPFLHKIEILIQQKTAPLCWLKHPNGNTEKFFVVWW
ncbi:DUF1853 family protein [Lutibacter aestuarii]|uniref:DUF1853 family protein n=1 Tax=Lutibacter aestuarii TaxID=861111 RepID=A0ABW2Z3Y5_9FLAO|nr:DUF1853 family protein [uncultured Lutibacter sp.]